MTYRDLGDGMEPARLTQQSVFEAGIASSLAGNPELLPEPSVYFQDFNFGATMWDAAYGNVDGGNVSGVGDGVADIAIDNGIEYTAEKRRENDGLAVDIAMDEANETTRKNLERLQKVSVGGVELTLEEWGNVRENLTDPSKLAIVEERLRAQGRTDSQIQDGVYLARIAADIAEKRGRGETLTTEERAVERRLQNDPEAQELLRDTVEAARDPIDVVAEAELTTAQETDRDVAAIDDNIAYGETQESVVIADGYTAQAASEYVDTAINIREGVSSSGNPFEIASYSPAPEFNTQALGETAIAQAEPVQTSPNLNGPALS